MYGTLCYNVPYTINRKENMHLLHFKKAKDFGAQWEYDTATM